MNYDHDPWKPRPVDAVFPGRKIAIAMKCCARCGGEAEFFNDLESQLDYAITGLCQTCQDSVYQEREGR